MQTPKLPVTSKETDLIHCNACGGLLEWRVPPGDERERRVCTSCGKIHYENPRVVAAAVAVTPDKKRVLLARRAIPPRGLWGIPAGFLENGESVDEGAAREALEECHAKLGEKRTLVACYSLIVPRQVQLVYRATLANEDEVRPGIESLETKTFEWDDIPYDELAFPTVAWALEHTRKTLHTATPTTQVRSKLPDGSFIDT